MSPDKYSHFAELVKNEHERVDYIRQVKQRNSPLAIVAPHGGGIEPGTSEIASAIAGSEFSLYCFEGVKSDGNQDLHITSIRFDDPACIGLVEHSQVVLAIHGCEGENQAVYVGGLCQELKACLITAMTRTGFQVEQKDGDMTGRYLQNICNRGSSGQGAQLELTTGLRRTMFKGLKRRERKTTRPPFDRFVSAIRGALLAPGSIGAEKCVPND